LTVRLQAAKDEEESSKQEAKDFRLKQNIENNRFELFRKKPTYRLR